jgi:hypothetical protein
MAVLCHKWLIHVLRGPAPVQDVSGGGAKKSWLFFATRGYKWLRRCPSPSATVAASPLSPLLLMKGLRFLTSGSHGGVSPARRILRAAH